MENRQPTYPGRVKLTPVPGQENLYDMERADSPTEEGTALNKQNLLQDATCAILGIPKTSVPNDAFLKLALGIWKYGYVITVLYPDLSPAEGVTVTGLTNPDGSPAVTNEYGQVVGVSSSESVSVSITSPFIDMNDVSETVIQSTGILTSYTIQLSTREAEISTSGTYHFSAIAKVADFCAVGGGGGGRSYGRSPEGVGGGGGYIQNLVGYSLSSRDISVLIGAGGAVEASGGATSVSVNSTTILTANGGGGGTDSSLGLSPGIGNGNGGTGRALNADATQAMVIAGNGKPASGYKFNDSSLGVPGGGGGGGCFYVNSNSPVSVNSKPSGGSPNGGFGGYMIRSSGARVNGTAGSYPGGGGGTGPYTAYQGAKGCLFVRTHYN